MEDFNVFQAISGFLGLFTFAFMILCVILFFKVWGMTDDVRAIKQRYFLESRKRMHNPKKQYLFAVGDLVVDKSGKQMRVKEIVDGLYSCYTGGGTIYVGDFEEQELRKFEE
ncbi:hypothetical protein [Parabacteroides sp.]